MLTKSLVACIVDSGDAVSAEYLQYLGDDLARGLLLFAKPKPLGPTGLYWLKVQLANLYGKDKLSLDGRVAWSDVSTRRRRLAEGVAAGCYARRPVMANRGRRAGDGCTTPRSSQTTVVESNRSFSTDPHRSQPVAGPYTECQTTSQGVVESPLALNAAQPPCCEISGHPCSSIVACGHSMAVIVSPLSISTVDCTRSGGSLASSASN